MTMTRTIDLGLTYVDGRPVYAPARTGLGVTQTPPPANFTAATNTINGIIQTADKLAPQVSSEYQSDFSKFNEKQAYILGTAAAVVQVIPGIGQVVGVVLGVVAAASAVLAKIFFNSKAKKMDAERGQLETTIKQILLDNDELDVRYNALKAALAQFKVQLKAYGIGPDAGVSGLGLCILGCKKKRAEERLDNTKARYDELIKIQENKIKLTNALYDECNKTMEALIKVQDSSKVNMYILFGLIASAALVGGIIIFKK